MSVRDRFCHISHFKRKKVRPKWELDIYTKTEKLIVNFFLLLPIAQDRSVLIRAFYYYYYVDTQINQREEINMQAK